MLKFSASVLSGEPPVNDGGSLVTLFQRRDLSLQYHLVADSTLRHWVLKTLNSICHVQPTAV